MRVIRVIRVIRINSIIRIVRVISVSWVIRVSWLVRNTAATRAISFLEFSSTVKTAKFRTLGRGWGIQSVIEVVWCCCNMRRVCIVMFILLGIT